MDTIITVNDKKSKSNNSNHKSMESNDDKSSNKDNTDNNNIKISNGWTAQNNQTLRAWKTSLAKASFIYEYVLEEDRNQLNKILICSLIISTLSTVISGISTIALTVGDDKPEYKTTALVINSILILLGALTTALTGAIKIYKLDDIVASISSYIVKIDQIYSEIANQLVLPDALRENAITFIKKESENYLNLIKQSPNIESSKEREAIKKYNEFLEDDCLNFKLSQKYNNDSIIDVI